MAEGEEVLYESLDSHSSEEDIDEYITISTPVPYLCPEVPSKATPSFSSQPGTLRSDAQALSLPKANLKTRSPIHNNPPHILPQAPPRAKASLPTPPNKMKAPAKMPQATSPVSRPPAADYHRIEDDMKPQRKLPRPPRLPKPRLSLKSGKKKTNIRYVPHHIKQEPASKTNVAQDGGDYYPPDNQNDDDDVYYDQVLSRTKWRNILKKKKKMKTISKQAPADSIPFTKDAPHDSASSSVQSSISISKKELEFSDDEVKLKAGNPRVICILLTIIIIALVVSITSLTIALVSVSSISKLAPTEVTPTMNCSSIVMSSKKFVVHNNTIGLSQVSSTPEQVSVKDILGGVYGCRVLSWGMYSLNRSY